MLSSTSMDSGHVTMATINSAPSSRYSSRRGPMKATLRPSGVPVDPLTTKSTMMLMGHRRSRSLNEIGVVSRENDLYTKPIEVSQPLKREPLNTERLRAITQQTRTATVSINDHGLVVLKFAKSVNKTPEIMEISSDGQQVNIFFFTLLNILLTLDKDLSLGRTL